MIDDSQSLSVKVSDRCFNYGDGCFTTMLVREGNVQLLLAHMSRFHQSCTRLRISNVPFAAIKHEIETYCAAEYQRCGDALFVVKVLISRGSGGRGYQTPVEEASGEHAGGEKTCQAQVYITKSSYPKHFSLWQRDGICLGVSPVKLGINPLLAGMKHCNRLEQVMIKQHMSQGVDDVVVLDANNHVVECSASNIFWYKDGTWFTPSLAGSGVAGVMRQCILAHIADNDWNFDYLDVGLSQLFEAECAIVCNSLTGPIVVNEIDFGTEQIRLQSLAGNVVKFNTARAVQLCESVRAELLSLVHGS